MHPSIFLRAALLLAVSSILTACSNTPKTPSSAQNSSAVSPTPYAQSISIKPLLKTSTDSLGTPIVYPTNAPAEISAFLIEIAPGEKTNWHYHPIPCLGYVLEGAVQIELEDGSTKTYRAGEAIVEVINRPHNGSNPGDQPTRLVFFALGSTGQSLVEKTAPSAAAR